MINKIITLSFTLSLIMFCSQANAQLGVKAGINYSNLNFFEDVPAVTEVFNEEFIVGYQLGLIYHVGLGDKLSFQPEAAFFTRGGKTTLGGELEIEDSFSYLNVDALVNYNLIGNNDGISVRIIGGIFGGYSLNGSNTTIFQGDETETELDLNDEAFNRSNVGYILGVGIKVNDILVSLRASIGVTEIGSFDTTIMFIENDTSYKTRDFSLVAAYLF